MRRFLILFLVPLIAIGCAAAVGRASYGPIEKQWKNEYAKREITLKSGVKLKYHDVGPQNAKTILFVHGMGDSSRAWYLVGPELLGEFRLIAPDLRGHGQSTAPNCCYAVDDYVADLVNLMDEIKIDKATFVGQDMGAFIARQFTMHHPERVEKLVLISSTDAAAQNQELDYVAGVLQTSKSVSDSKFQEKWFAQTTIMPVPDVLKAKAQHERSNTSQHVWEWDVKLCRNYDDREHLTEISVPTMILWGDQDRVFGKEEQVRLQNAIRNSTFKSYAGAGHTVQWEQPKEVAADIAQFVRAN